MFVLSKIMAKVTAKSRVPEVSLLVLLWIVVAILRQDVRTSSDMLFRNIYGVVDSHGTVKFSYGQKIREYRTRWRSRDSVPGKHINSPHGSYYRSEVLNNAINAHHGSKIGGWMDVAEMYILFRIRATQLRHNVFGNVAEIGVHHGLFLSFLTAFAAEGDKTVAIDLFESLQSLNHDNSGQGSLQHVTENLKSLGVGMDSFFNITTNSMNLSPERLEESQLTPFRLFSVDGGHSFETTMNDMLIAAKTIHPLGVIVVDDALGVTLGWSGVTDAIFAFVNSQVEVVPFFLSRKKIYLCLREAHKIYYSAFVADNFLHCAKEIDKSRRSIGGAGGSPSEFCYFPWTDSIPSNFLDLVDAELSNHAGNLTTA